MSKMELVRSLALVVLVVLVTSSCVVHAEDFVVLNVYPNSTRCDSSPVLQNVAGLKDQCLNSILRPTQQSMKLGCSQRSVYTNPTCSGTPILDTDTHVCTARTDMASQKSRCQASFAHVIVKYYKTSDCSGDSVQFLSENSIITSTQLNLCTISFIGDGNYVSMRSVVSDGELVTSYFRSSDCQREIQTLASKFSECNEAVGFASTTDYKYYTVETSGVTGQVDLNADAKKLNKQIAGASIGVLCGFTALLVLISMTGILG